LVAVHFSRLGRPEADAGSLDGRDECLGELLETHVLADLFADRGARLDWMRSPQHHAAVLNQGGISSALSAAGEFLPIGHQVEPPVTLKTQKRSVATTDGAVAIDGCPAAKDRNSLGYLFVHPDVQVGWRSASKRVICRQGHAVGKFVGMQYCPAAGAPSDHWQLRQRAGLSGRIVVMLEIPQRKRRRRPPVQPKQSGAAQGRLGKQTPVYSHVGRPVLRRIDEQPHGGKGCRCSRSAGYRH